MAGDILPSASITDSSKLFHAVGPVMANALLPNSRRVRGTRRSPHVAERSCDSVVCGGYWTTELSDVRRSHTV